MFLFRSVSHSLSAAIAFTLTIPTAQANWGQCGNGKPASIADCTRILNERSTSRWSRVIAHANRGLAYENSGQLNKALEDYTASIGYDRSFKYIRLAMRARTHLRMKNQSAAIGDAEQARKLIIRKGKKNEARDTLILAYRVLTTAKMTQGQYGDALNDVNALLQLAPRNIPAFVARAKIMVELNNWSQADTDLNAALGLNRNVPFTYVVRAQLRMKRHDYKGAIEDANTAFGLGGMPNDIATKLAALRDQAQASLRGPDTVVRTTPSKPEAGPVPPPPGETTKITALPNETSPITAPSRPPKNTTKPTLTIPKGQRVALVIGNAAYKHTPALTNPLNDANDVAERLTRLGFKVIKHTNLTKSGMDQAFRSFARAIRDADATLFYYAGHAMQFQGVNYLMPIDARLEDEADLPYEMAKLNDVVADMNRAKGVRIAVLDACRDNPLEARLKDKLARTRSITKTRGLARIPRADGLLMAFATQAGRVAQDGEGRNSPFTGAFLKHMTQPNLEVGLMFRRVANSVYKQTRGRQLPELSISLLGEFYFARK